MAANALGSISRPFGKLRGLSLHCFGITFHFVWIHSQVDVDTILLVILVLMLLGALPTWNHSRSWGYFPSGGLGLIVVVLLVLLLAGRI
jgi:hypothetical protein